MGLRDTFDFPAPGSRPLKLLHVHMKENHPEAFFDMVKRAKRTFLDRLFQTPQHRYEVIVLERACARPQIFPIHVLADERVVELIKKTEAKTSLEWFFERVARMLFYIGFG